MGTKSCDELVSIYRGADLATGRFADASRLACPPGCGTCCTRFTPPVTAVEADEIYHYLRESCRDGNGVLSAANARNAIPRHAGATDATAANPADSSRAATSPADAGPCPFYDAVQHCTIYPVRPLVCRLFAFSGLRGASGQMQFSLCAHMPGPSASVRSYRGRELRTLAPVEPPDMQLFAMRLAQLPGGDPNAVTPIDVAVRSSRDRTELRHRLLQMSEAGISNLTGPGPQDAGPQDAGPDDGGPDDGGPDDGGPKPRGPEDRGPNGVRPAA